MAQETEKNTTAKEMLGELEYLLNRMQFHLEKSSIIGTLCYMDRFMKTAKKYIEVLQNPKH